MKSFTKGVLPPPGPSTHNPIFLYANIVVHFVLLGFIEAWYKAEKTQKLLKRPNTK